MMRKRLIPAHDTPGQLWVWGNPHRDILRKSHLWLSCRAEDDIIQIPLKTAAAANCAKRIARGLSLTPSPLIAAEIAARRQIMRAFRLFWTDLGFIDVRGEPAQSAHHRLRRMDALKKRIQTLSPLPLPKPERRWPILDYRIRDVAAAGGTSPHTVGVATYPDWTAALCGHGETVRQIEVTAASQGDAACSAEALACAELQHLMVFLARRDPNPAALAWADHLLRYVPSLSKTARSRAIGALAGDIAPTKQ